MSIHNVWKFEKRARSLDHIKEKVEKSNDKSVKKVNKSKFHFAQNTENEAENQISNDQLYQMNSRKRVANWATENQNNYQLLKSLKTGLYEDHTVFRHKFRDDDPKKNISGKNFFNRRYQSTKLRAKLAEKKHKSLFLEKGPYKKRKAQDFLERKRRRDLEISHNMRYKIRTENQRIQNVVDSHNRALDLCQADLKMLKKPNWRTTKKSKFKGKSSEKFLMRQNRLKDKPIWNEKPLREFPTQIDPYIYGLQVTGDMLIQRSSNPELEINKKHKFISHTRKNLWQTTLDASNTIRTGKMDFVVGVKPENFDYSQNKKLKFYKKALVQTGSVDKITPFQHSQSYRNASLKNVRPIYPKIFPKSALNQIDRALASRIGKSLDRSRMKVKRRKKIKRNLGEKKLVDRGHIELNHEEVNRELIELIKLDKNSGFGGFLKMKKRKKSLRKKKMSKRLQSNDMNKLKSVMEHEDEVTIESKNKKKLRKILGYERSTKPSEFENSEMKHDNLDVYDNLEKISKKESSEKSEKNERSSKIGNLKRKLSRAVSKIKTPMDAFVKFMMIKKGKKQLTEEEVIDKLVDKYFVE